MTAVDTVNSTLIRNKRLKGFEQISDFGVDVLTEMMKKYARIKCLEAIRNTRYAAIDIVTHHIDSQFNLPVDENDVHDLIRDIQNIPDQDVMPKL